PTPSRTPTKKSCGRCRNSSTKRETSHVDRLTEISGFPAYNPYLGGADLRRARTPRAQRDLAHEARRLLEANLGEPPASLELARQLGVGETTLRRIFKNEFGRSMLQYVRDRRLEIGRQMVREGRWQIAQIAYRLGYSSPENFTHAYRARFGHPPGRE
ncbi:helix-turn-helix domain-containing protein, partial [Pseudomonas aeruginosa]|uniref:helix-turn-helix domain-containing protein n=1 Tax=Pseudomonas aeruginosa TaxID=287 RepID=UPI001FCB795E